jgi:hypothetical protein
LGRVVWGAFAGFSFAAGLLFAWMAWEILLALYGSVALFRPPVPARVIGWTQMGFGLLVVLATALGYTLEGVPTALLWVSALHRNLGYFLIALAFLVGFYLLRQREVPRLARVLLGLYALNALFGLLYLGFSGRLLLHSLLALLGVALLHALLKRPYPWPGVGFLLRGFAPLALSPV